MIYRRYSLSLLVESFIKAAFVLDMSGNQETAGFLIRKTIDSLTTMFSKNIQLTLLSVSQDGSGKTATLYHAKIVLIEAEQLKMSLRETPTSFNKDLLTTVKDAFGDCSTAEKYWVVFFFGSQPLQYAFDVVSNLRKIYPTVQILAVTAHADVEKSYITELELLTGSNHNVLVAPQGSDIAQYLK